MHPRASDYWDGNWLITDIVVEVGSFHGELRAALRADELQRFRRQLEELYRTVSGTARLESMEDWIDLVVKVDAFGHVTIDGQLQDRAGAGNRLAFEIGNLDQSDLPPLIEGLVATEAAYPVLGAP